MCNVRINVLDLSKQKQPNMSVRKRIARTSTNHIFVDYNGQSYMLETGSFQTKAIVYETKKKLLSGKLTMPDIGEKRGLGTILIICSRGKDGLQFSWI